MDYESEMVVITIVFAMSYMRVLKQKSGLQVVDKSTYKSLTTQYTLLTDELFAEHFISVASSEVNHTLSWPGSI